MGGGGSVPSGIGAWSRRTWRSFRRWPTWVQVLAWVFYGWIVLIPLAIFGGALTKGTFTPEEAAERRRMKVAAMLPTRPVPVTLAVIANLGVAAIAIPAGADTRFQIAPAIVLGTALLAVQPVTSYVIGRAWALWLPAIAFVAASIVLGALGAIPGEDISEQWGLGLLLYWPICIALMMPGLVLRRYLQRRRSVPPMPTGLPPPPPPPP